LQPGYEIMCFNNL